jgi:hypothetical protein
VWVWGFWFGFALRRVALLCGVFVRLHQALFPAGGPFLPSLYVNLYTKGSIRLHDFGSNRSRKRPVLDRSRFLRACACASSPRYSTDIATNICPGTLFIVLSIVCVIMSENDADPAPSGCMILMQTCASGMILPLAAELWPRRLCAASTLSAQAWGQGQSLMHHGVESTDDH